jgi:hypothetical protein
MAKHDSMLNGTDLLGEPLIAQRAGNLSKKFIVPPFSVLSARDGWWQDRKRAWLALGIKSELGRGVDLLALYDAPQRQANYKDRAAPGGSLMLAATNYSHRERGNSVGRAIAGTAIPRNDDQ